MGKVGPARHPIMIPRHGVRAAGRAKQFPALRSRYTMSPDHRIQQSPVPRRKKGRRRPGARPAADPDYYGAVIEMDRVGASHQLEPRRQENPAIWVSVCLIRFAYGIEEV